MSRGIPQTSTSDILNVDQQTTTQFLWEVHRVFDGRAVGLPSVISRFEDCLRFFSGDNRTYTWREAGAEMIWADNPSWSALIAEELAPADPKCEVDEVDVIRLKLILQYYEEVVTGFANPDHLGPLINRLQSRVSDLKRVVRVSEDTLITLPLTIVSLRDVRLELRKMVPMLLCKQLYELKKSGDASIGRYLNLVIDEAHNVLSTQSARESEVWRDYRLETFEEIVKEGRKFGVFLTLASQRPHDISDTIISQLHHYFLHRLVNELDIRAVERAVAYLDRISFEAIPILPTGSCVIAGFKTQVPVIVEVGELSPEFEPYSRTIKITDLIFGDS